MLNMSNGVGIADVFMKSEEKKRGRRRPERGRDHRAEVRRDR